MGLETGGLYKVADIADNCSFDSGRIPLTVCCKMDRAELDGAGTGTGIVYGIGGWTGSGVGTGGGTG